MAGAHQPKKGPVATILTIRLLDAWLRYILPADCRIKSRRSATGFSGTPNPSPDADLTSPGDATEVDPMNALREYCLHGHRSIVGWLQPGALSILWSILEIQHESDIRGDLSEIGVYQGKLFLMLALALREGERAHAIDPFKIPKHPNFRARFDSNLAAAGIDRRRIDVHKMLSEAIAPGSAAGYLGTDCRLISIDGAHTRRNVMHDLVLADECLSAAGVVALDDFFNPWCADLTEGVFEYLRADQDRHLVPFAIADSTGSRSSGAPKLFLCRSESIEMYQRALVRLNGRNLKTRIMLCGATTQVFDFTDGVRKTIIYRKAGAARAG